MGQRANYIIKDSNTLRIHYNHWRANSIASDLYLGEKRFLEFVNECQLNEEILDEPWIEGCVIIDKNTKSLFFWSYEFSTDTSVVDYYLKQLSKKWAGWTLNLLKNRMYDVEKVLGIDYISKQDVPAADKVSKEVVLADKVGEWVSTLVIIKQGLHLFVRKTGNLSAEMIINYGQEILPMIKNKPEFNLPKEGEEGTYECVLVDEEKRRVLINESRRGLVENCKELWSGYKLLIGDFGYLETLRLAGIETTGLELPDEEVKMQFAVMVTINDRFNPFEMAEKLNQDYKDVQFNPDFFDNVKPKKAFMDKLKTGIKKLLRQK